MLSCFNLGNEYTSPEQLCAIGKCLCQWHGDLIAVLGGLESLTKRIPRRTPYLGTLVPFRKMDTLHIGGQEDPVKYQLLLEWSHEWNDPPVRSHFYGFYWWSHFLSTRYILILFGINHYDSSIWIHLTILQFNPPVLASLPKTFPMDEW